VAEQLHRSGTKRNGQTGVRLFGGVAAVVQAYVSCALACVRGAGGLGGGAIMCDSRNTSKKGLISGSSANHLLNRVQCKCLAAVAAPVSGIGAKVIDLANSRKDQANRR
jgi:hypothetical protein